MRGLLHGVVRDHRLPSDYKAASVQPTNSAAFWKNFKRNFMTRMITKNYVHFPIFYFFGFATPLFFFRWNFNIPKELYRVPLFIMIEALVSGRILHDSTPTWISLQLWLGSIIPLFLQDDKIPQYYRLVLVYIGHCMLNLVDAFLLNLTRPDSPPIYGLIGLAPMELPDFQV